MPRPKFGRRGGAPPASPPPLGRATSVGGESRYSGRGGRGGPPTEDEEEGGGAFDMSDMMGMLTDPSESLRPLLRGVVKIFCTLSEPSFTQCWTMRPQQKATGSGFLVKGGRIITNAHVVAYQTSIQVRKHGDAMKYVARPLAVAHDCDVAILTVDDPAFWEGAVELEFAPMPRLQQEVFVVGYPVGGDTISVTGGVVSRLDFDAYAHSAREHLVFSVDAAINPGNSGGPALSRGKVVGIAFQSLAGAEATGYIIPTPVVQHVLGDLTKHGRLTGFARLGFSFQTLENPHMKAYLKVPKGVTGILVNKTFALSNLHGVLAKNDVVNAIDGHTIADDGTVVLRDEDRIACGYLLTNKFIGDAIEMTVYRGGVRMLVTATVEDVPDLVPPTLYERKPQFLVHGGLVFTAATDPYLEAAFGGMVDSAASLHLIELSSSGEMETPGQQVVVLSKLLSHDVTIGYEEDDYEGSVLASVDGKKVNNLLDAARACAAAAGEFIVFEFEGATTLVMPTAASRAATADILRQQSIPAAMSADLLVALGMPVPDSMALPPAAAGAAAGGAGGGAAGGAGDAGAVVRDAAAVPPVVKATIVEAPLPVGGPIPPPKRGSAAASASPAASAGAAAAGASGGGGKGRKHGGDRHRASAGSAADM